MIHIYRRKGRTPGVYRSPELREEHARAVDFFATTWHRRSQRRFDWSRTQQLIRQQALPVLLDLFHSKCAYCETRLDNRERANVERFRPKSGALDHDGTVAPDHYWWLAFEWQNTLVTCQPCNVAKAGRFPVKGKRAKPSSRGATLLKERPLLLDPTTDDPESHLIFVDDGHVASATTRGQKTIEILSLNREALVQSRAFHVQQLSSFLEEFAGHIQTETHSSGFRLCPFVDRLIAWLSPEGEFLAPTRQVISRWAKELAIVTLIGKALRDRGVHTRGFARRVRSRAEVRRTARAYTSAVKKREQFSVETDNPSSNTAYFAGARKLQRVEIAHFKGIDRLELTFAPPMTNSETWMMLVGENGTGKSSVLQAIGLALMGQRHINTLGLNAASFVSSHSVVDGQLAAPDRGCVRVHLTNLSRPIELHFERGSRSFRCDPPDPQVLLLGYGATRLLPRSVRAKGSLEKYIRVKNLFDPFAKLNHVEGWLTDTRRLPESRFNQVALALKELLLLGADDCIERRGRRVFVHVAGHRLRLTDLSDGYQSVVALAVDIMIVVSEKWPAIEAAEAIVLLDEIEVHLHPFWKMQIVERFRRVFPKLAFVATTHDPLCLRGLLPGEVVVLRSAGMNVEAEAITQSLDALRADQLLTSPLFGLAHTRARSVQDAVDRYAELFGTASRTADEQQEFGELRTRLGDQLVGDERVAFEPRDTPIAAQPSEAGASSGAIALGDLSALRSKLESLL